MYKNTAYPNALSFLGRLAAKTPRPGFPLQFLGLAFRKPCGISAAIPGAWAADRFALPTRGFAHDLLVRPFKKIATSPGCMGGRPFCATNAGLRPRPACTALKEIATSPAISGCGFCQDKNRTQIDFFSIELFRSPGFLSVFVGAVRVVRGKFLPLCTMRYLKDKLLPGALIG
jgi:hypothetical protein